MAMPTLTDKTAAELNKLLSEQQAMAGLMAQNSYRIREILGGVSTSPNQKPMGNRAKRKAEIEAKMEATFNRRKVTAHGQGIREALQQTG